MPARKDRTGETTIANNGMKMTIIAYRNSRDIDVQFDDGAVRKGVKYQCFIKGEIRHPKEQERLANLSESRIGETSIASNGMKMTIIAYCRCDDMDVQFEDGSVRKGVQYAAFKIGKISHPNELRTNFNNTRIGDISVATNGMKMTIITYRSAMNIDVQFEDGVIKKHVSYNDFKKGYIKHPNEKDRTDETTIASNGMKMTIIAYRNSHDIDVQFENGTIRKHVTYAAFKKGYIRHPAEKEHRDNLSKSRVGETSIANNGMKMTIIAYRNACDIDVQFEDGTIRKHVDYKTFKNGHISHPNEKEHRDNLSKSRVGETTKAKNGMKMTIIAYRDAKDIDVQFEDGAIRKHVAYNDFKKGYIRHPNEKDRTDETTIASNGMKMTIIAYRNSHDIDVQFEDGKIIKGIYYSTFKRGEIKHPNFPMRVKGTYKTFETQYAYTAHDGSVFFYCECHKCGWKKNLTARELINLNHTCENIEGSET